jgi:hypothetical protein
VLALGLILNLPLTMRAQLSFVPIATQGAVMSFAFDGSNYLCGVEIPGPLHTVGAQLMSSTGARIGSLIPTGRTGIASGVAFDGTNYLLIWEDDEFGSLTNESYRIYGQFISKVGATVGAPFDISGLGAQFDGIKTMAYGGGKYLVTYTRLVNTGGSWTRHIAGRIVDPTGTVGNEFRISTGGGKASDVAFDGANFFVVWCEDTLDREIRGRLVSPTGVAGLEISVNATVAPSDNPNSVCFNGTNYLVVWNDEFGGTAAWDSFGQLVSPSGALVGGVITISAEPGPQMVTSVASDGRHFLTIWVDMQSESNWDVYGRYVGGDGSLLGSKIPISTDPDNQIGGVGFANGHYLVLVSSGLVMGEGGIIEVDSAFGAFVNPPADPKIQTDEAFGVRENQFGFTFTGIDGSSIVVEASTNLASPDWIGVSTNTISGGTSAFHDPQWMNHPGRYYRLRSL